MNAHVKNTMLTAAFCLGIAFSSSSRAAGYGGGTGTAEDPYQIWTPQQMNNIGTNPNDWDDHFILMADLNMSIYTGTAYNIIGNTTTKFIGTFNGNGHQISYLTYTTSSPVDYVGLFGCINGAVILNLRLENVAISSQGNYVASLAGLNEYGTITACSAAGTVTGTSWYVGGLVGYNNAGIITACCAGVSVSGLSSVGGLTGVNEAGTITAGCTTGSVAGQWYVGGLVGYNDAGTIAACYAASAVTGLGSVGGLSGDNYNNGIVTASFWDTQVGNIKTSAGGFGKTTTQMKTRSTFTAAGWDFTNETANGTNEIWRMCSDGLEYPRLNWQSTEGDFSCPNGLDAEDLSLYFDHWLRNDCILENNYCSGIDLNFSGVVNLADWALLAQNWISL